MLFGENWIIFKYYYLIKYVYISRAWALETIPIQESA